VEIWPEDIALSYLAMQLAQPIKWIEERWKNMLAYHGRGYSAEVEAAAKRDVPSSVCASASSLTLGVLFKFQPWSTGQRRAPGRWTIRHSYMDVECLGVLTNKPPTGPTGAPEDRGRFFHGAYHRPPGPRPGA